MQNKRGFTLLELIVAMAIIAVLMGLSLFGIQAVQRSQRDTERRAALSNINLEIAAWYGDYGSYPVVTFDPTTSTARVGPNGPNQKTISLKGAAKVGTDTTNGTTVYCYSGGGTSTFQLGVKLESSGWGAAGTAQQLGNNGMCSGI